MTRAPAEPRPSATVVPIRDAASGVEVLLLERSRRPGSDTPPAWVFPGGKIDERDAAGPGEALELRARRAAVREALEEAGLVLAEPALVPISRWITPEISPDRYDTWFYLAAVGPRSEVRVDGFEIAGHRWLAPQVALAAYRAGEIRLAPPTFVTVSWLEGHRNVSDALARLAVPEPLVFRPRICRGERGACILYPGDAGYEAGDPSLPGPRHRLWTDGERFRYQRSGV